MADIDLTAAIEAAGGELSYGARALHEFRVEDEAVPHCACGWRADHSFDIKSHDQHIVAVIIEAALPHIREALAQQIDQTGADIEQAQLAAMGGLLTPLPSGVVAGYAQAARIVRGES